MHDYVSGFGIDQQPVLMLNLASWAHIMLVMMMEKQLHETCALFKTCARPVPSRTLTELWSSFICKVSLLQFHLLGFQNEFTLSLLTKPSRVESTGFNWTKAAIKFEDDVTHLDILMLQNFVSVVLYFGLVFSLFQNTSQGTSRRKGV